MWATDVELAKAIVDELLKRVRPQEHNSYDPSPEPAPFVPEKVPKHETYMEMLQRRARDDVRAGRAISANIMRPTPRPPRAPNQQKVRFGGAWWYYR